MTSYDANGAPVEGVGQLHTVKRFLVLKAYYPEGSYHIEPMIVLDRTEVVLASDHDAAIQRLSEQLAEAKRECEELRGGHFLQDKELLSAVITAVMNGKQADRDAACLKLQRHILAVEAERDSLSTALAAERERGGRMEAELEEVSPMTPCARCGKRFRQHTMTWEEGDELECFECNARCNAEERAALAQSGSKDASVIGLCQHDPMTPGCTLRHQFTQGRTRCDNCGGIFTLPLSTADLAMSGAAIAPAGEGEKNG